MPGGETLRRYFVRRGTGTAAQSTGARDRPPALLWITQRASVVAAIALAGIAATVGAANLVVEHTHEWARVSRETARIARHGFALAIDRETSVRGFLLTRDSASLAPERVAGPALAASLDSLDRLTADEPAQHARARAAQAAVAVWERTFATPALRDPSNPRWRDSGADGLAGERAFDAVRDRFEEFLDTEDARYAERVRRDRAARQLTALVLILELGTLAAALLRLRRRLLAQAHDLLRQQHILEEQATELEIANHDVTEAADALRESEGRFRSLVEQSPDAILLHADGRVLYMNPAYATLLGIRDADAAVGMSVMDLVHPDSRPLAASRLGTLYRGKGEPTPVPYRLVRQDDGSVVEAEIVSMPIEYGGRAAVRTHARDVTAQRAMEAKLEHQSLHDPLTGLANRVLFRDRVGHAIARAARGGPPPCVLFLDLDNFKPVNDSLGHAAGDALLVEVAARLRACVRPEDTCARFGGDEFALLLERAPDDAARATAGRVVEALGAPFPLGGTGVVVGVSVGIAHAGLGESVDEVLRNADIAMYRAKAAGRGRAEVFEPSMHAAARRRFELEAELRRAIESVESDRDDGAGTLVLYYQPVVDLEHRRLYGAEALVRWRHPGRGLVPPIDFIPIAEETGLILPLGRWVLREACRQLRAWHDAHPDVPTVVSVNLSARQLARPELVAEVADAVADAGAPAARLVLEMTEGMLIHDNRATLERLDALKSLGVRLAIDDFGTGYSSLSYLERFPVDVLKIDRSFVRGVGRNGHESPVTLAVISLARALGMVAIAEGVETERQLERLRELGCDRGQGYLFGRPEPAAAMTALLERHAEEQRASA
jgi:diguanylate cyclase (GGDEF)-like protein/PAS domain S-box-containing protein